DALTAYGFYMDLARPTPVIESHHPRSLQCEGDCSRRLGTGRPGGDGPRRNGLDRREHSLVSTDDSVVDDSVHVYAGAVVEAGTSPGADIGVAADAGVADIAEVVDLAAGVELDLLRFHEIADLAAVGDMRVRPQARERPELATLTDHRMLDHGIRVHMGAVAE